MNVDPILEQFYRDANISRALHALAEDTFCNNECLLRLGQSGLLDDAMNLMLPIVRKYSAKLARRDAYSGRFFPNDYQNILFMSKGVNSTVEVEGLSRSLAVALAERLQKTVDDYVEQLMDTEPMLPKGVLFDVNDEGMICLSDLRECIQLRNHAIDLGDGRRIYLHQFLRRNFSGNFVGMPRILLQAMDLGHKVEARVDPFRIGDMERYQETMECDNWHGPKFSQSLLECTDKTEIFTVHNFSSVSEREQAYSHYTTIFRTSMLDRGSRLRQFSIEEYVPECSNDPILVCGVTTKFVVQRTAHFVYDQKRQSFEHIDGSVRVFNRDDYAKYYNVAWVGNDPGRRIGMRYKLFKIAGDVSGDLVKRSLYEFFRGNIHLVEYFQGLDFVGADQWFEQERAKNAELVKKMNKRCPY